MRITKKLAKEIFDGNYENLDLEALIEDREGNPRTNYFSTKKELELRYIRPSYIAKKDFDGMTALRIVYLPNEDYAKSSKGVLMTDVFTLINNNGTYFLNLHREPSHDYKNEVEINFNKETRSEILERLAKETGITF